MKKYILVCICLLAGMGIFTSCEDLTPKVYSQVSDIDYPKTEKDLQTYLTGLYGFVSNGYNKGGFTGSAYISRWSLEEATTDEFTNTSLKDPWGIYSKFSWTASDKIVYDWTFKQDVKNISRCMLGIYYLSRIQNISDAKRKQYEGEFYTIASMFAYSVYELHGAFPIVTDPKVLTDANTRYMPQRPAKEETIATIKKFAEIGVADLPETYAPEDYGKVTKGTALMILLKLAMHEKNWAEADKLTTQFKALEDKGVYILEPKYMDIFSAEHKQSKEIILAGPMSATDPAHYNCWLTEVMPPQYASPDVTPFSPWNMYKVTWAAYDKYWDHSGCKPYPNPDCNNNTDERLKSIWDTITVYANGKNAEDGYKKWCFRDSVGTQTGAIKWVNAGAIPYKYPYDPKASGGDMGNDWVIFRYADVLLLRAEAEAHLGNTNEAIALVNRIRNRAHAKLVDPSDFNGTQAVLNFILDERFRELFMEGVRREDMIRNGTYIPEAIKRGAVNTNGRELFPIPQYVINQCGSAFPQNPGY